MTTTTQGAPRLRGMVRTLRGDIGKLLGTGMAGQALLVVSGPLVARMLGPTGRGQAALILAVATVCNFLSIASLIGGISRTVARRGQAARDVVGPFLGRWLLRCVASAVVAAVTVSLMLRSASGLVGMVAVGATIALAGGTLALLRAMLLGEGNIRRVTLADLSLVATYVVAVVVLFVVHRQSPVGVVMLAYLCGQLVSLLLVVRALRPPTGAPADPTARTEANGYARRAYFGSIANLDRVGLDSVLIGHLLGATLLGLFAVASSFATVPAMVVGPLAAALLPRMAARTAVEAAALMRRWVAVATALCVAASVVLWIGMGRLILLFFGAAFEPATWTGRFLLVANSAFALRVLLIAAAGAQERERLASRISLVASALALVGLAVGARVHGLAGATVGMTIAAVAGLAAMASVISWTGRPLPTLAHVRTRAGWLVRDRFPHRRVVRVVQGVEMTLPWSHRLPDYARGDSPYGQNLVALARGLGASSRPLVMLDVGANVGDSTLQVLDATDARVVCVEADDFYLDYLRRNCGQDDRVRIEPALLLPDSGAPAQVAAVRAGGTTRFVADVAAAALPTVTPAQLRTRHAWLDDVRLVKSDTDGHDVALVPAIAEEYAGCSPVLFFEYDLRLSRLAGHDPLLVWDRLADRGYQHVAVWDNGGEPVGLFPIAAMASLSDRLEAPDLVARKGYWDVAVAHATDADARAVLAALVPDGS